MHIKAFTAIEIIHFTRIARLGVREVLMALREAGLGSMPGGGAEIFDDRVHDEVFKGKVRADKWFEVHRIAHSLGIYTNATMLYGHVERPEERVGHMIRLREVQAEALAGSDEVPARRERSDEGEEERHEGTKAQRHGGSEAENGLQIENRKSKIENAPACFNCMIPLSFIPEQSELGHLPGPTGLTDLKTLAIARLMLYNIAHIKSFWIMQGIGLSQMALSWGLRRHGRDCRMV